MDSNIKVIEAFNQFAEKYADSTFSNLLQYELNRFIALLPKNGSLLDVGCGSGRDVHYFLDENLKVVGVDASEKLIMEAKKKVESGDFRVMNMLDLSFDEGFDGVWALDVVSYLSKDKILDVLKQFSKVLKESGILFISVRKGEGEKLVRHEKLGKEEVLISFFGQNELEGLLKKSGFEILNSNVEEGEHFTWINMFAKKK